jgi:hypothetical protein
VIRFTNIHLCGLLPTFVRESDPRPAAVQINERYIHGGWNSFKGFALREVGGQYRLTYPEDPPRFELARAKLRDETIVLFQSDWVAVIQPDGSFDVARID